MDFLSKVLYSLKISYQTIPRFSSYSFTQRKCFSSIFSNSNYNKNQLKLLLSNSKPQDPVWTPFFSSHQLCISFFNQQVYYHGLSNNIYCDSIEKLSGYTQESSIINQLKSSQQLLEKPFKHKLFTTATRGIIVINEHGVKESSEVVLKRFRRLGNGLWIHHQPGRNRTLWKKFLIRKSAWKVYKLRRTIICNHEQSKLLDKMVSDTWKKQKWYVDDPYKGYTEETMFYYHPKDLPWNTLDLPKDYYKYAWRRYDETNKLRKIRKTKHKHVHNSMRKRIPHTTNGYCFS